jgi:hypothetical protein
MLNLHAGVQLDWVPAYRCWLLWYRGISVDAPSWKSDIDVTLAPSLAAFETCVGRYRGEGGHIASLLTVF